MKKSICKIFWFVFWGVLFLLPSASAAMLINEDSVAVESEMAKAESFVENIDNLLEENLAEAAVYFSRPKLVKMFSGDRKVIFTFDDGPHPRTTPQILEILKKRNIKAIFFVLGLQAEKYPDLVKRIYADGHEIGNHSYNHKNLAQLSETQVRQQISRTNEIITGITGKRPTFLRPPYGALNKQLLRICQSENMNIMLWTVDPKDWQNKNEATIVRNLSHQLGLGHNLRGGAILLHDIYPATVRALDPILDRLFINDYRVVDAGNMEMPDQASYWAAAEPTLLKSVIFKRKFNPEISGNDALVKLLSEKTKPEPSSMAMLRASRNGDLLVYLLRNQLSN